MVRQVMLACFISCILATSVLAQATTQGLERTPVESMTQEQLLAHNCGLSAVERINQITKVMMVSRFVPEVMKQYTDALEFLKTNCPRVEEYECPQNTQNKLTEMNNIRITSIMTPEGSARFEREYNFYQTICNGTETYDCKNIPNVQKLIRESKYAMSTVRRIAAVYRKLGDMCHK